MELIYGYLDQDVADWLRKNAPKPMHGQNYHQWLSEQYGLKKLIEHIWKVIGIASTCQSIDELKKKMRDLYGKVAALRWPSGSFGNQMPPDKNSYLIRRRS